MIKGYFVNENGIKWLFQGNTELEMYYQYWEGPLCR